MGRNEGKIKDRLQVWHIGPNGERQSKCDKMNETNQQLLKYIHGSF
jgi:hypothetical protein